MAEFGLDISALARELALPNTREWSSGDQLALLEASLIKMARPHIGFDIGQRVDVHRLGVFGYALMNSATGADALRLLVEYQRAVLPHMRVSLKNNEGSASADADPLQQSRLLANANRFPQVSLLCHAKHLNPEVERFSVESFAVSVRNCSSHLLGFSPSQQHYHFDYPAPDYAEVYHQVLGENIEFNAPATEIVFSSEQLAQRISRANPVSEALYRQQCDVLLKQLGGSEPVSSRVQQLLLRSRGEFPRADEVASQLNMSESTLRRKLKGEGSSYQRLLDQLRLHLANQYLQTTQISVAEVGRLLGFDDVANFRRAFRRWSGVNPSQLREEFFGADV